MSLPGHLETIKRPMMARSLAPCGRSFKTRFVGWVEQSKTHQEPFETGLTTRSTPVSLLACCFPVNPVNPVEGLSRNSNSCFIWTFPRLRVKDCLFVRVIHVASGLFRVLLRQKTRLRVKCPTLFPGLRRRIQHRHPLSPPAQSAALLLSQPLYLPLAAAFPIPY